MNAARQSRPANRSGGVQPGGAHPGPIPSAALVAVLLHRVVMRVRPAGATRPVQRERVDDRPGARVSVKFIKRAQHRLGMRAHRRARTLDHETVSMIGPPQMRANAGGIASRRSASICRNRGPPPESLDPTRHPCRTTGIETTAADPSHKSGPWTPIVLPPADPGSRR
jgi:hypothetical protein